MDAPYIYFSSWDKWKNRERLSDDFDLIDIPDSFGMLGIYLLATPCPEKNNEPLHFSENIIYIGLSTNITRRLIKSHHAVKNFRNLYGNNLDSLYYSKWESSWLSDEAKSTGGKVRTSYLHYIERKLIWEHSKKNGYLPALKKF